MKINIWVHIIQFWFKNTSPVLTFYNTLQVHILMEVCDKKKPQTNNLRLLIFD